MLQNLDCGTKSWRSLTPPCTPYLCSAAVTSVEFANDNTLVSADDGGKTKVWNIATGEEKTEALAGSKFTLSKQGKDERKQQVGRFLCTAEGDLLLIHLLSDVEEGGDKAAKGAKAAKTGPAASPKAPECSPKQCSESARKCEFCCRTH